jgi:hypothetical protein
MSGPPLSLSDIVRNLAIRQSGTPNQPVAPQPMDTHAVAQEIAAFAHRGGKLRDGDPYGIKTPGGTYGGEFSDEDFAAYLDAVKKLGFAQGMERIKPLLALHDQMSQRPDATAVAPSLPNR